MKEVTAVFEKTEELFTDIESVEDVGPWLILVDKHGVQRWISSATCYFVKIAPMEQETE